MKWNGLIISCLCPIITLTLLLPRCFKNSLTFAACVQTSLSILSSENWWTFKKHRLWSIPNQLMSIVPRIKKVFFFFELFTKLHVNHLTHWGRAIVMLSIRLFILLPSNGCFRSVFASELILKDMFPLFYKYSDDNRRFKSSTTQ